MAATGPYVLGAVHAASGGWTVPFLMVLVILSVMIPGTLLSTRSDPDAEVMPTLRLVCGVLGWSLGSLGGASLWSIIAVEGDERQLTRGLPMKEIGCARRDSNSQPSDS